MYKIATVVQKLSINNKDIRESKCRIQSILESYLIIYKLIEKKMLH